MSSKKDTKSPTPSVGNASVKSSSSTSKFKERIKDVHKQMKNMKREVRRLKGEDKNKSPSPTKRKGAREQDLDNINESDEEYYPRPRENDVIIRLTEDIRKFQEDNFHVKERNKFLESENKKLEEEKKYIEEQFRIEKESLDKTVKDIGQRLRKVLAENKYLRAMIVDVWEDEDKEALEAEIKKVIYGDRK